MLRHQNRRDGKSKQNEHKMRRLQSVQQFRLSSLTSYEV